MASIVDLRDSASADQSFLSDSLLTDSSTNALRRFTYLSTERLSGSSSVDGLTSSATLLSSLRQEVSEVAQSSGTWDPSFAYAEVKASKASGSTLASVESTSIRISSNMRTGTALYLSRKCSAKSLS